MVNKKYAKSLKIISSCCLNKEKITIMTTASTAKKTEPNNKYGYEEYMKNNEYNTAS